MRRKRKKNGKIVGKILKQRSNWRKLQRKILKWRKKRNEENCEEKHKNE